MTDPITISRDELRVLIKEAIRDELFAVGLRTDSPDQAEAARDDQRFVRRLRLGMNGFASKVGMAVITVVVSAVAIVLWKGWEAINRVRDSIQ